MRHARKWHSGICRNHTVYCIQMRRACHAHVPCIACIRCPQQIRVHLGIVKLTSMAANHSVLMGILLESRAQLHSGASPWIPEASTGIPGPSTGIPGASNAIPGASTGIPGASTGIIGASTGIPGASTGIPGASTRMSEYLPHMWQQPAVMGFSVFTSWMYCTVFSK